jgi:hypothetical protein
VGLQGLAVWVAENNNFLRSEYCLLYAHFKNSKGGQFDVNVCNIFDYCFLYFLLWYGP